MAVTASRLGGSAVTVDWSGIFRRTDSDAATLHEAWQRLKQRLNPGDVGFYDCPVDESLSQATATQALANSLLQTRQFTDCLFLGIGGSALGPISLTQALQHKTNSGIRFHFMENPDPLDWKNTIKNLRPDTTLVCAVTKSGTTFETMALTSLALEWIGKSRWKTHLVAITDPTKGDLREFAEYEKIPSLSIAPSIGGRFSIFSPVGLFPAALSGLSVPQFLQGAKQVRDHLEKAVVEKSPVFILATELIRNFPKRPIHVCMPYSSRLKTFGAWFTQLWSESLGKEGKGFSPIAAVGAVDQHSILQLLRDGPDDKVTFFVTVDQVDDGVQIPKSPRTLDQKTYPAFRILEGHSLADLLRIEHQATSLVLTKQMRPQLTIGLDRLDERSMGATYFLFCSLTAIMGTLWGVNPFDQPGVEEGKAYIRQALSHEPAPVEEENPALRLRRGEDHS